MFNEAEEKYITRILGRNEVVLFLGSGFSRDSKNKLNENFPTGRLLSQKIWNFLGYTGDCDDTSLQELYQAFLGIGKKRTEKIEFLNQNLLSGYVPDIYDSITIPYWYKIYSLNIDDILDVTYRRNSKLFHNLVFPQDEYRERDQSLEKTQCVYLHGKLPCNPEDVIFSTKQYARASLENQPLYSQFVYEYATLPTIFLGTDLNENLFESYIEAREGKSGYGELRPKSFIITPSLSPVKKDIFKSQYNVHHISGTTEDFLNWLRKTEKFLPEKNQILINTFPNLLKIREFANITQISQSTVSSFAQSFERVPKEFIVKKERSGYLLGANPIWNDIYRDLDIPRTITNVAFDLILESLSGYYETQKQQMYTFVGNAGSGKSTILKRLGLRLSQNGRTVFICNSEFLPRPDLLVEVLSVINEQVILIFDNAKNIVNNIPILVTEFAKLKYMPLIVLGIRKANQHKLNYQIDPEVINNIKLEIPDLDDEEIDNLIFKLDENNLLGLLKGMTPANRIREFKFRAKKQILIAMKEATNGKSFNEIIQSEFDEIDPYEAKSLCVCIALNTELGFSNTAQDFIGFSNFIHSEALHLLKSNLDGIIQWNETKTSFMIRHRILADYIIKHCTDLDILKDAYIRVLSVLAPELKKSLGQYKKFNLYKSLINHQILYGRFKGDINLAREVYDSITEYFHNEAHFWLQYGSLEMTGTGGNLALAENYILQAESLAPDYINIQNSKCNLFYRLSVREDDFSKAYDYKQKADEICTKLLNDIGKKDPHIYHIQCKGIYSYILKWSKSAEEKKEKLKELRRLINYAVTQHPRDKNLEQASNLINRSYLLVGIDDNEIEEGFS
jgi:energy-coupling factor transporter ATP-binding protein EcfA2